MKRKPAALCFGIFAFGVFVLAIIAFTFAVMLSQSRFFTVPGGLEHYSTFIFGVLLSASIIALIGGILGLAATCIRHRCLSISFGCIMTPVMILTMVSFGAFHGLIESDEKTINIMCDPNADVNKMNSAELRFHSVFSDYATDIDGELGDISSKWMCSKQCPCNTTDATIYNPTNYTEAALNKYGRTRSTPAAGSNLVQLHFPEVSTDATKAKADYYPTTFFDCYFDWEEDWKALKSKRGETPTGWQADAQADFEALSAKVESFDLLEYLEVQYNCSGFCKTPLFFFALPAKEGQPQEKCLLSIRDEMLLNGVSIARANGAAAVFFLITWLLQYCLWFKFKDD